MKNYRDHLILSQSSIEEALNRLNTLAKDAIMFVTDENDLLIGSLTDGDIRRGLIKGVTIDRPVNDIIQTNPKFIRKGDQDIAGMIALRDADFRIIPVLDPAGRIIKVINFREILSYLPVDAVIMAGGKGQRLMPLTATTPKPLLKVADLPIIEHNLNRLSLFGIDDFWISINYLGEQIESHFGDGADRSVNVRYVRETKPLGTIGSVAGIRDFQHDYVLITNSDLLTNLDYESFFLEFIREDADMAVVTVPYNVSIPYAVLETRDGTVTSFKEKPTYTYYSNGGIYLVKRKWLELIPEDTHYNTTDLMERLINDGKKVFSYPLIGYWLDIGSHDDFAKAQVDFKSIKF